MNTQIICKCNIFFLFPPYFCKKKSQFTINYRNLPLIFTREPIPLRLCEPRPPFKKGTAFTWRGGKKKEVRQNFDAPP